MRSLIKSTGLSISLISLNLLVFIAFFYPVSVVSQELFPSKDTVFIDNEVPKIEITISEYYLNTLLSPGNEESNIEYPSRFVFKTTFFSDTVYNVGFRLRGNTSRVSKKKSFKISFNTFIQGQKFLGLEKLNLNGEHNDPSIIRSLLSWNLLAKSGIPASRSNHIELYINGVYKGLYINVEHIDEQFVKTRFGNNDGNLFKCLWPSDLAYKGSNQDSYKFSNNGVRTYDLKTNVLKDDYTDLVNFINIVNNTSLSLLPSKLEQVFNVNNFLKYLAIEALVGNWDGYSYNKNNFYLYHNLQTNQFEFIPYDLDNTFGIDWFGIDWANRNIYNWAKSQDNRPLTKRILQVSEYRDRFTFFVKKILQESFNTNTLNNQIENIKAMITPYVINDAYRSLDYGWDINDFSNSYYQALGDHVKYGLIPYIETRYYSAISQLAVNDVSPIISNLMYKEIVYNQPAKLQLTVEDEDLNPTVKFHYQENNSNFKELTISRTQNDQYIVELPSLNEPVAITFYITATDNTNKTTREPRNGFYRFIITNPSVCNLVVNEIMANNNSTIKDDYGEYSDWIELYNPGPENIWLGDKYLSDNLSNTDKWLMPDTIINAGEFIVFWADATEDQGSMHTSFKLSAGGEEIGVFESDLNGNLLIDGFNYSQFENDFSCGRFPDGTGLSVVLSKPTPGEPNIYGSLIDRENLTKVKTYPNPFNESLSIEFDKDLRNEIVISITNLEGQVLLMETFTPSDNKFVFNWNARTNAINAGIYILKIEVISAEKQPVYLPSMKLVFIPD